MQFVKTVRSEWKRWYDVASYNQLTLHESIMSWRSPAHNINLGQLSCSTFPVSSLYPLFICMFGKKLRRQLLVRYVCLSASVTVTLTDQHFVKSSFWASQEIPRYSLYIFFIAMFGTHVIFVCCARLVHSTNSYLISLRSSGLLFSHLSLVLTSGLFLLGYNY